MDTVHGKSMEAWEKEIPLLGDMRAEKEVLWTNPAQSPFAESKDALPLGMADVEDAAGRLSRFAPYIASAFPETAGAGGRIESPLCEIAHMAAAMEREGGTALGGRLFLKMDSHLPISGSIKARGGIYEVLKFAEDVALREGRIGLEEDYGAFASEAMRACLSRYTVAVGSTGNLGLSIGVMAAKLGFSASVHMSADARQWKKDMLRAQGVEVVEYASDYSVAVAEGRARAAGNPLCHFVDDENSQTLFLGYAVAALRLQKQLEEAGIRVDEAHPLCVYLPCGVGGGPGGVAFGLKLLYGDAAHIYFAEPTAACCMLLGMASGLHEKVCVQDFGLSNKTVADGLAVGRPSGFVGRLLAPFTASCYTLRDERMLHLLALLRDTEDIRLEPSALAGLWGPVLAARAGLVPPGATHIAWATGGGLVPQGELEAYYAAGKAATL